jgi:arylsulfatase A-like enzyme
MLSTIPNKGRRTFAAMTIYLDDVISKMVDAFKAANMWESTVLVYASDNGGDPPAVGCGSNWPLRGRKATLYEGGVKVPAFIHSPLISSSSRGITYDNMMHVTDWLPTLIEGVLGRKDLLVSNEIPGSTRQRQGLDGVNQWTELLRGGGGLSSPLAPRSETLLNIDYLWGLKSSWQSYDTAAIIVGHWKLILKEVNETVWPTPTNLDNDFSRAPAIADGSGTDVFNWLFNLADDPTESENLYDVYPEKVAPPSSFLLPLKILVCLVHLLDSSLSGYRAYREDCDLSGEYGGRSFLQHQRPELVRGSS